MAKFLKFSAAAIGVLCVVLIAAGVLVRLNKPPRAETMRQKLEADRADFAAVAEYLAELDHDTVSIDMNSGSRMLAGFENHYIHDEKVLSSIEKLRAIGCADIWKDTEENSIQFELWSRFDVCAGLLFRINDNKKPSAQFLTELEEIDSEGWFYYVEDHNEWRSRQNKTDAGIL